MLPPTSELCKPSAKPPLTAVVPLPVFGTGVAKTSGFPAALIQPGPAVAFKSFVVPVCPSKSPLVI